MRPRRLFTAPAQFWYGFAIGLLPSLVIIALLATIVQPPSY